MTETPGFYIGYSSLPTLKYVNLYTLDITIIKSGTLTGCVSKLATIRSADGGEYLFGSDYLGGSLGIWKAERETLEINLLASARGKRIEYAALVPGFEKGLVVLYTLKYQDWFVQRWDIEKLTDPDLNPGLIRTFGYNLVKGKSDKSLFRFNFIHRPPAELQPSVQTAGHQKS